MSGEEALGVGGSDGGSEGKEEKKLQHHARQQLSAPLARKHARGTHATTIVALPQRSQCTELSSRRGNAAI